MAASHGRRRSNTSPSTSQAPGPRQTPMPLESGDLRVARPWGKTCAMSNLSGARYRVDDRGGGPSLPLSLSGVRRCPTTPTRFFADRHIGPDSAAVAAMLEVIGVDSLEELARRALPAGILDGLTGSGAAPGLDRLPPAATEAEALAELRALADANTVAVSMIGQGYYDTLHTAGVAAQHLGEPGLVHRLYAVPAGDQPGSAGGAAELPDHGRRPDRPRGGQRIDARRGHRGRRGDDADASRGAAKATPTGWPSTSTCSPRPPPCWPPVPSRWASRSSPPTCVTGLPDGEFFGVIAQLPGRQRPGHRLVGAGLGGPRPRRAGRRRRRPAGADADHAAGGDRRRRGVRQHPTFRCANGIRRSARRIPGGARQARPPAAGPAGRRLAGRRRLTRLPAGTADPRAAHPSRQGDQQHLHRSGAAGGDGGDVCELPRRRRTDRHRAAGARSRRGDRRRSRRCVGARQVL